ncbi:hypothetical protein pdam_00000082 [Pocillopora damicornis]|uniref:Uncharacterized protein n=1 Tax=Pocillopora damicornis TaxID=46731 RepID=A0A3M6UY62_POCDA|nr:hypothetical protein pdam_00000082 [Pocillopora damicornis]
MSKVCPKSFAVAYNNEAYALFSNWRLHQDLSYGIEIPGPWMPTIKKHNNRRAARLQIAEGANH